MASTRDIRRRIRTVKNIEKITNAMKMVAAARLKKAQARAEAARPYAEKMHEVVGNLAASAGQIDHPLLEVREERKAAYVIIGADRGLAGSYNGNVMHKAIREIGDRDPDDVKLILVGKKAIGFFRKKPYEIVERLQTPGKDVGFLHIRGITSKLRSMFESREVDAVYLVYARFITAMTQHPACIKLLPMTTPSPGEVSPADFIFEPDARKLLADLLPRYVDTQVYQALVEAQASEQGARMTSMSAATKNAGEMIDNLTLIYNKARQAAITKEIVEIVGGAEALK
jgi:F-type H+-transporting ATPase subunit gamma